MRLTVGRKSFSLALLAPTGIAWSIARGSISRPGSLGSTPARFAASVDTDQGGPVLGRVGGPVRAPVSDPAVRSFDPPDEAEPPRGACGAAASSFHTYAAP